DAWSADPIPKTKRLDKANATAALPVTTAVKLASVLTAKKGGRRGYGTGVSRKACDSPLILPQPTIWPASLMLLASRNIHPELGGRRLLRNCIWPPLYRKANSPLSPTAGTKKQLPTIWPNFVDAKGSTFVKPQGAKIKHTAAAVEKGVIIAASVIKMAELFNSFFSDCAVRFS